MYFHYVLQFSKAVGKIKDVISALPVATVDDDKDEATALAAVAESQPGTTENKADGSSTQGAASNNSGEESSDPFGLDDLLEHKSKKSERAQEALNREAAEEESKRYLRSRREALLKCLEIAARRYRIPW